MSTLDSDPDLRVHRTTEPRPVQLTAVPQNPMVVACTGKNWILDGGSFLCPELESGFVIGDQSLSFLPGLFLLVCSFAAFQIWILDSTL